jgi:hypothetical protein
MNPLKAVELLYSAFPWRQYPFDSIAKLVDGSMFDD